MGASASPDLYFPKQTRHRSKHADRLSPEAFRREVWLRDQYRDRATGQALSKTDPRDDYRGEVAHLKCRRVRPDWKTDPARAVLLSAANHRLSDHRGGYLLKMTDPETGEPATDGTKKIKFTMYDRLGRVVWTRIR